MTLSVGLPESFELHGVFVTGPARRVGDSLVYPARIGHDPMQLREYWPADLLYRTAAQGAVAVQQVLEAPVAEGRAGFTALTRALEAFDHPLVPPSTGFEANGSAYRVTRTGRRTLGEILARGETLPPLAVARLAAGLADALEAAHAAGLLHLDVQPHTVAVTEEGVELTGFSTDRRPLMKPAGRQDGLVTPGYSPIELHDGTVGDPLGAWTDIHAASALLRRLIVGAPFIENEQSLRLQDAPLAWPDSAVPPSILDAVEAGLKVHPEDRPQSVAAWRAGWAPRPPLDAAWRNLAARSAPVLAAPEAEPAPDAIAPIPTPPPAAVAAAAVAAPAPTPSHATPIILDPGPAPAPPTITTAGRRAEPDDIGPLTAPAKKKPNEFVRVLLSIAVVLAVGLGAMNFLIKPREAVEVPTTYYVTRGVRVRPGPSTANRPVTELPRGQQVRGVLVMGDDNKTRWLKLLEGPHRGQYVWERNLSRTPRPPLTRGEAASLNAQEPLEIRAEPRQDAAVVGRLDFGDTVQVQGETAGGWSELALSQGGGVGYVRSDKLGEVRVKSHDPETAYEATDGESEDGGEGAPTEEPH